MKLSIIIVNYNVCYFLEQCLCSVRIAISTMADREAVEVFVVDNNSSDNSLKYLSPRFPEVRFLENQKNLGFSRANNQAIALARGEYILFLNPDTILPEDCVTACLRFMDEKPEAGALGIRMIDGTGHYLPESKRGFPSPWISFCKMFGLTSAFPSSRLLAGYYMGHLDQKTNNEADILSGAYMMVKKKVLDKTGGFDERFFMYAEDIDLSYRIQKAGFRNYYFAGCTIVHFKGESTRKDSFYVKQFYKAMVQFVRKHYSGGASIIYARFLELGIWLRASVSFLISGNQKSKIKSQKIEASSVFFQGDDLSIAEAKAITAIYNEKQFTVSNEEANEIIYCQGVNMPLKTIIALMQTESKSKKIHLKGTSSIVGSSSSKSQGDALNNSVK